MSSAVEYAHYRPMTPTCPPSEGSLNNSTHDSVSSSDSSPWSTRTGNTSPSTSSSIHHHGPTILPKIRTQDTIVEPVSVNGPLRHGSRVLSSTRSTAGFAPYPMARPPTSRPKREIANRLTLISPVSPSPLSPLIMAPQGSWSALSSPITITPPNKPRSGGHSRSFSASGVDSAILNRFGYPTYRGLPEYVPELQAHTNPTTPVSPVESTYTPVTPIQSWFLYPSYPQKPDVQAPAYTQHSLTVPTPRYHYQESAQPSPTLMSPGTDLAPRSTTLITTTTTTTITTTNTTTLLSYLTQSIQPIKLVRNVSVIPTRGLHDYFWWDIRNLRSWTSFSLESFDSVDSRLTKLLKTQIPHLLTPPVAVSQSALSPESEPALVSLIRNLYAPRVNAALAVSQGEDHLQLYAAPDVRSTGHKNHGHPHFLANYPGDTDCTSAGLPRGRLVGIVKSFDRWNTGMRNEAPHRRVEYLNGLAHLQRCMREHSCRYGFIITEIELVCVRAGCDAGDDVPYFGYLEIAASIPLKTARRDATPMSPSLSSSAASIGSGDSPGSLLEEVDDANSPMTASLALYFLLMLSKSVPLPQQPSAHLNVGGPGALTRQRILSEAKDKWIPEPQIGEKRDAKRVRGWVWPQDAWHRREGGGVQRAKGEPKTKKWHK